MKTKIITIALITVASFTNQLVAQEMIAQESDGLKTRTKSNQCNERTAGYDLKKNIKCRVIPTETGCTIAFDNVGGITGGVVAGKRVNSAHITSSSFSVSSTDNSVRRSMPIARGHATSSTRFLNKGREASAPSVSEIVVTKSAVQESQSSGMGAGKATFKEFTVTKRCDGKTTKISCPDGECDIPVDDCSNGSCDLVCEWSWGASNAGTSMSSSSSGRCVVDFSLDIQEGVCHAITKKGDPRSGYDLAPAKK